jgi:hypothetical protein
MKFRYQNYPVPGIGSFLANVRRPMVPILASGPVGDVALYGLVDTGADNTLISDRYRQALGAVIQPNMQASIVAIGGATITADFGTIDLELRKGKAVYRWSALVGFYTGNRTILGHAGVLEHFRASFNHSLRHFHLNPVGNFPAPVMAPRP